MIRYKKRVGKMFTLGVPRLLAGRAFRSKSSPLVPHGCGLSTAIPHA